MNRRQKTADVHSAVCKHQLTVDSTKQQLFKCADFCHKIKITPCKYRFEPTKYSDNKTH